MVNQLPPESANFLTAATRSRIGTERETAAGSAGSCVRACVRVYNVCV